MSTYTMPVATFTQAERDLAMWAWNFCAFEIDGSTGLLNEFGAMPGEIEELAQSALRHPTQLVVLRRRIDAFAQFVAALEQLQDKPVMHHHPLLQPPMQKRVITAETVTCYRVILDALVTYITILETTGRSPEAWDAALAVAATIHPGTWRLHGVDVPEGAADPRDQGTGWFLAAVRGPG